MCVKNKLQLLQNLQSHWFQRINKVNGFDHLIYQKVILYRELYFTTIK